MTWSIVARDPETGSFGAAVATRFVAAAGLCLNVTPGTGAVCTQAMINPTYGPNGLQLLGGGAAASDAIAQLLAADAGRDHRQVHAVDRNGTVGAATGSACHDWSGHRTGVGVSVAGNLLAGPAVVRETLARYESAADLPFAERLLAAMEAGQQAGGDQRGQQSAGILIHGAEAYPDLSLRVDEHPTPLAELRRIYQLWLLDFAAARKYMATHDDPAGVYDEAVIEAELQRRLADPAARTFPV
ncbi:DUF1028 domain-containing protein [Nakamurella lactea]|uniref:DUF1028 domain-containing protein n=1 Tax=Nakamurella lactea TaxID=459515 RepID=UPI0003F573DD|nr:DUF1028 domain-containing protein [Nakamurella lactea]